MVALGVGIVGESSTDTLDHVEQGWIVECGLTQLHPVLPQATGDDVVDRSRPVAGIVVEVAV